ncbi:MAG: glycoside hydrolase family 16 protein [Marinoscillum sp.]
MNRVLNLTFGITFSILLQQCSPVKSEQLSDDETSDEYHLVWQDNFDSAEINTQLWTIIEGNGCPDLCGFGNEELQNYTSNQNNLRIEDGVLILEAHKESKNGSEFTSAKVVTKNKGDWQYGKLVIRAKVPYGRGTWPAIWMLPTINNRDRKWPIDGEIDIMEHVGYNQGVIYGTIHSQLYNHKIGTQKVDSIAVEDSHEAFHDYGLFWEKDRMTWTVDGKEYFSLDKNDEGYEGWPFDQPHHLILNLAVGGTWGGSRGVDMQIWPQRLEIDFVKVYQKQDEI